jgi:AcrR family transcriptional regulator
MATAGLEDPKVRMLEAAGRIFAERGFRDATVRDICQAAQVNLAAVNYHFGDKERLYIESVKHAHRTRLQQVPMPKWPPGTTAAVKLHGFIYAFLCRVLADDRDGWEPQLMMRELAQPTLASACTIGSPSRSSGCSSRRRSFNKTTPRRSPITSAAGRSPP